MLKIIDYFKVQLLVILLTGSFSYGQTRIQTLSENDISIAVNSICQDKKGFIWLATNEGIIRYDGYTYEKYAAYAGRNTIPKNISKSLFLCRNGNFYAGSGGLCRFNYKTVQFETIENRVANNIVNKYDVECLCEDAIGLLWYITKFSINNYNSHTGKCENLTPALEPITGFRTDFFINALAIDSMQNTWVAYNSRIVIRISEHNQRIEKRYEIGIKSSKTPRINQLYVDSQGRIWLSASDGMYLFNKQKDSFEKITLPGASDKDGEVIGMTEDFNGCFWISSVEGLFKMKFDSHLFRQLEAFPRYRNILKTLFIDRTGVLWIGTEIGVDKIDLVQKPFKTYCEDKYNANSLLGNHVTAVFADSADKIWVGTTAGLTCIDRKGNHYTRYTENPRLPFVLSNNKIFSIQQLYNSIFIGGTCLQKLDLVKNRFEIAKPEPADTSSLKDWIVWDIFNNKKTGHTWIATFKGFCSIKNYKESFPATGQPVKMNICFDQHNNSSNRQITYCILEDSEGIVWAGSANGIIRYDPVKEKYQSILIDTVNYFNSIKCVFEDSHHGLWFGTEGHGLLQMNRRECSFRTYEMQNGFQGDVVWGMEEDNKGCLWLSTSNGLTKFSPSDSSFRNFDMMDGLPGKEFTQHANCKSKKGEMFFGSVKGLVSFFPDSIKDNLYPPGVEIENIYLFNKPVSVGEKINGDLILEESISETKEIRLSHKNTNFSIAFTALHYANPQKNIFKYKLDGFDKDWIITGSENRKAFYPNLLAGTYLFHLNAANCDGIWNKNEVTLSIIIIPPFWKTWWFRILIIIIIISVILIIYNYRVRSLERQKKTLELTVEERTHQLKEANRLLEDQKQELASQADVLKQVNQQLLERQNEIESASEEIKVQSEELQFTNEELKKLNATKDRLFSIIGHDLKNPFHAILNFSELLKNKYDDFSDAEKKEFLEAIHSSSQSAYELLQNLLDWALSQTNRISINPADISLYQIASGTLHVLGLNAENKNITIINQVPESAYAFADHNMITTVLRNLINNAIKFTPENGSITVSFESKESVAELSVSDTGVGMNEEIITSLFRIDKHHSTSGTSGETGTGLGLIISKDFIEKSKGSILVKSVIGKGTTFTIQIPESKFKSAQSDPESRPAPKVMDQGKKETVAGIPEEFKPEAEDIINDITGHSLLIVEDNLSVRKSIRQVFTGRYEIFEAGDGRAGLELALEHIPNLIICDVVMPVMNGFELCENLKTNDATSHIPVILLTAEAGQESQIKGLKTGADDYLTKPFSPQALELRVKNLIETRNKLREIYSRQIIIEPSQITITTADEHFIKKAIDIIEVNISDIGFGVDEFTNKMAFGRTRLYKKVKEITGLSVNDFIRSIRLKRAAQILQQEKKGVAELAFMVGFNYPEYFSKCFKKEFGILPSEYPGHVQ